jgi:Protein of unknown function (DUF1460)
MFRLRTAILGSLVALNLSGLTAIAARSDPLLSPADQAQLDQTLRTAKQDKLAAQPFGTVVQAIARRYLGARYQAGLLDRSSTEQLLISFQKFDCVLFVESMLALARIAVQPNLSSNVPRQIEVQRYRSGHLKDYCSRLHYFSDWIADNERRGLVRNVTLASGGIPLKKPLDFMTQHRSSYPQLQKSEAEFTCLKAAEASLAQEKRYYIPTAKISGIYPKLQAGDIVAIATAVPGLDVTHTGLLERRADGGVGMIHASPAGSVTRANDLQTYVKRVPDAIGIIVARPNAAAPQQ